MFTRKSRTAAADKYQVSKSVMTMPNKAQLLTEKCASVSLLCFQKISDMVPARRDAMLPRSQKYFIENYDPNEEHLPSAVCARCKFFLRLKKEEKTYNDVLVAFDFS